ncbi:MAG: Winged helix-turn-helix DNA-binding [Pseudomonadota bacterium]|jgi:lambda repressor-like predicted transcriptional regulator
MQPSPFETSPDDPRLDAIPTDPRVRHIWIKAELELADSSFSKIARELGCAPQNVRAAMFTNLRRPQEAVANALGLPVHRLFPEWFDGDVRVQRGRRMCEDNSEGTIGRNVEAGQAA